MSLSLFARRSRQQNSHKADAEKRVPAYLQWLRGRPCYLAGRRSHECRGKVRACHVDHAGDKGMGTKVSDMHALPMCDGAHDEQHSKGWASFEMVHRFNAVSVAADYWAYWLGHTSMGRLWTKRQAEGAS